MSAPPSITTDDLSLRPPVDDDVVLVAELLGVPESAERPAEIVRGWQQHWSEHGYGVWIVRDAEGRRAGFVGLADHEDFIRLTMRWTEDEGGVAAVAQALRLAVAHVLEWLPDLPLRIRFAPTDEQGRAVAEAAGLVHVPDLDHEVDGDEWVVLELPWVRVADRIPPRARAAMLRMWVEVNDAGGAVGFLPGASEDEVAPVLDGYVARLEAGDTVCVALNSPLGDLLGFGFVVGSDNPLLAHTANLERVMIDPAERGANRGSLLMAGLHRAARARGVELVTLDHRGGTGLERFYTRFDYAEVGRLPGAIRVAPDDDRDSVLMARSL